MPRKLLLFAALAVAGSMLVLWLVTRDRPAESSPAADEVADARVPGDRRPTRDRPRPAIEGAPARADQPAPARAERPGINNPKNVDPSRPTAGTVEGVDRGTYAGDVRPAPLEYTLPDGRRVRDFRDPNNRKPLAIPPSIHPPGGRKIPPELTSVYTDEIIKHMRTCAKAVPSGVRGPKPRVEGQIVIAIAQEQGRVTGAVFRVTDLTDAAVADAAKQCVEQAALTVRVPAAGQADLDSYSINLSLALL